MWSNPIGFTTVSVENVVEAYRAVWPKECILKEILPVSQLPSTVDKVGRRVHWERKMQRIYSKILIQFVCLFRLFVCLFCFVLFCFVLFCFFVFFVCLFVCLLEFLENMLWYIFTYQYVFYIFILKKTLLDLTQKDGIRTCPSVNQLIRQHTPWKINMEPTITHLERNIIFPTIIFRFHVKL